MQLLIRLGKVRTIHVEMSSKFGLQPVFEYNTFSGEKIFDFPCMRIIYTPGNWEPTVKD